MTLKLYHNLIVLLLLKATTHPYNAAAYSMVFLNLWNSISSIQLADLFATDPRKPAHVLC